MIQYNAGQVAQEIRNELELEQKECAELLGITNVHLCNVEKMKTRISQSLLERMEKLFGVNPYILAWAKFARLDKSYPVSIRGAANKFCIEYQKVIPRKKRELAKSKRA